MPRFLAPRNLLILLLLLVPSTAFLWQNDDLAKFCDIHDDCLYFVSGKSIADGGGYRIESLPGEPAQTKYPPLYPAVLSLAWLINPVYPDNLPVAAWISWLALPLLLFLLLPFFRQQGMRGWRPWLLLTLIAINPYVILFSASLLTEFWYMALVAGSLLLAERVVEGKAGACAIAVAGALAGLAYLTRTAGIVLLATTPLYLWIRHQRRSAVYYAGAMLPFIAAWMVWAQLNRVHTVDPSLMYYVDYLGYQFYNVSPDYFHILVWKNLDSLFWALGSLVIPNVTGSWFLKILSQVIAVAMIAGLVRLIRRGFGLQFALFGLASVLILLVWHYPLNERFVLPVFPLVLLGLCEEMEHLARALRTGLRHPDRSQRVAARGILAAGTLILLGALGVQVFVSQVFMPIDLAHFRTLNADKKEAFAWIRENTPPDAQIFASRDPMLYLATGRHATSRPIPPRHWYLDEREAIKDLFRDIVPFAQEHHLSYVLLGKDEFWVADEDDHDAIDQLFYTNPDLELVFQHNTAAVFRVPEAASAKGSRPRVVETAPTPAVETAAARSK